MRKEGREGGREEIISVNSTVSSRLLFKLNRTQCCKKRWSIVQLQHTSDKAP